MGVPRAWKFLHDNGLLQTVTNLVTHIQGGLSSSALARPPVLLVDGLNLAFHVLSRICSDLDLFFAPPLWIFERELIKWHNNLLAAGVDRVIYVLEGPRWELRGHREQWTLETQLAYDCHYISGSTTINRKLLKLMMQKENFNLWKVENAVSVNAANYFPILNQLIHQICSQRLSRATLVTALDEADHELMRLAGMYTATENCFVVSDDSDFCFADGGIRVIRLNTMEFREEGGILCSIFHGSQLLAPCLRELCGKTRDLRREEVLLIPGLVSSERAENILEAARMIYDEVLTQEEIEEIRRVYRPEVYSSSFSYTRNAFQNWTRDHPDSTTPDPQTMSRLDVWRDSACSRAFFEAIINIPSVHREWPKAVVTRRRVTLALVEILSSAASKAKAELCERNSIDVEDFNAFVDVIRAYYRNEEKEEEEGPAESAATSGVGEDVIAAGENYNDDDDTTTSKVDSSGGTHKEEEEEEEEEEAEEEEEEAARSNRDDGAQDAANDRNEAWDRFVAEVTKVVPAPTSSDLQTPLGIHTTALILLRVFAAESSCSTRIFQALAAAILAREIESHYDTQGVAEGSARSNREAHALRSLLTFNCIVQMLTLLIEIRSGRSLTLNLSRLTIDASLFLIMYRKARAKVTIKDAETPSVAEFASRFDALIATVERERELVTSPKGGKNGDQDEEEEWEKPGATLIRVSPSVFAIAVQYGGFFPSVSARVLYVEEERSIVFVEYLSSRGESRRCAVPFVRFRNSQQLTSSVGWCDAVHLFPAPHNGKTSMNDCGSWVAMKQHCRLTSEIVHYNAEKRFGLLSLRDFDRADEARRLAGRDTVRFFGKRHLHNAENRESFRVGTRVSFRLIILNRKDGTVNALAVELA